MAEPKKVYRKNKSNGTTYIYLDQAYWDAENQTGRHKMKCIGKVGPNGEDIYNDSYKLSIEQNTPVMTSNTVLLGEKMILNKVSESIGLPKVIKKVFGKEEGEYLLALAFFVLCSGDPLYLAEAWCSQRGFKGNYSSQAISKFLETINQDKANTFFKEWISANSDKKSLLFDITSISSHSEELSHVEWGYNRDKENLRQINLSFLSSYSSMLPLWFNRTEGSLNDSTQLNSTVKTLKNLRIENIAITADRAFCTDENLKMLKEEKIGFTLPVPSTVTWQKELISSYQKKIYRCETPIVQGEKIILAATVYDKSSLYGRVWKHIYFDVSKKNQVTAELMQRVTRCRETLKDGGKLNESDSKFAEIYLIVKDTPKRGRKVTINQKAIEDFINGQSCWWVIISNCEKDATKAYFSYKQRNNIEILFNTFKNSLKGDRTKCHNDNTLFGRLFMLFIALIVTEELKIMVNAIPGEKRKWWNWKEFLRHALTYNKSSYVGTHQIVYSTPTKGQRMIFDGLNISYMWKGQLVTPNDMVKPNISEKDDESSMQDLANCSSEN